MKLIAMLMVCVSVMMPLRAPAEEPIDLGESVYVETSEIVSEGILQPSAPIKTEPIGTIIKRPVVGKPIVDLEPVGPSLNTFASHVIYANWSNDARIKENALNSTSNSNLSVYRLSSVQDIANFKAMYSNTSLAFNDYDALMTNYGDMFFTSKSLILVYIPTNSGSARYDVVYAGKDNRTFTVEIAQTNKFENGLTNMSGWFAVIEVPNMILDTCHVFDANMTGIITEFNPIDKPVIGKPIICNPIIEKPSKIPNK